MRRSLFRKPVEPFAELVADTRLDQPLRPPSSDRRAFDAKPFAELPRSEHPGSEQALLEARELRRETGPLDAGGIEGYARAGEKSALVEDVGDLGVGILAKQRVDLLTHFRVRGA